MAAHGMWIRSAAGSVNSGVASWLTLPDRPAGHGVLILPAVGYDYSSSHRFIRMLSERFAADGGIVVRLDYFGTGDSAGSAGDVLNLEPWRMSVRAAAGWLRDRGVSRLTVVGVQIGAMLAALELDELRPAAVVTVAGVFSGRRYARGLSMIGLPEPFELGGVAMGGAFFTAGLLADLTQTTASIPDDVPHLKISNTPTVAAFLQQSAEDAQVDPALVDQIGGWVRDQVHSERAADPSAISSNGPLVTGIELDCGGSVAHEEFVTLGRNRMVGVLTSPPGPAGDGVYVLVNSGSDPHIGPGRAWVELARRLAADGVTTLRVDFRGWGESPDGPTSTPGGPGRPYDQHTEDDTVDLIEALHARGKRVVLGGLCAGAWIALATARRVDFAGCVVLNPQIYWDRSYPAFALLEVASAYLKAEFDEYRVGAAEGRWDREDEQGLRPPAGVWLDELGARGMPVTMIFAEGDEGIEYLRTRLSRRTRASIDAGWLQVEEIDVDHSMHKTWLRPKMFDLVSSHVRRTFAIAASSPRP